MGKLIDVNKKEFDEILNSEKGIILVDFWAPWCGPCKVLGPTLQTVSDEIEDITILKVNVDDNPELSTEYGVRNIPVVHAIKNGEKLDKFIGALNKEGVISFINNLEIVEESEEEDE